jgi:hypothetical protein
MPFLDSRTRTDKLHLKSNPAYPAQSPFSDSHFMARIVLRAQYGKSLLVEALAVGVMRR